MNVAPRALFTLLRPPLWHFSFHLLELLVFVKPACFFHSFRFWTFLFFQSVYVMVAVRLNSLCSGLSIVVMRWPTVPCLCYRVPTTYRHPNLEGEQVGQQTTALHQSLWRRRWAEGSFGKFGAHLELFQSQVFTDLRAAKLLAELQILHKTSTIKMLAVNVFLPFFFFCRCRK